MSSVTMKWLIFFLVIIKSCTTQRDSRNEKGVSNQQLENWTSEFGQMLYELSRSVTKYSELQRRFQNSNEGVVEKFNLNQMLEDILAEIDKFNNDKIKAIQLLAAFAEQRALEHLDKGDGSVNAAFDREAFKKYWNAKKLQGRNASGDDYFRLVHNPHFSDVVNVTTSTVHVPTSIFDEDENILQAVAWSRDLDGSFIDNYRRDPTLSWQYFGSSTGFLRQFPGVKWKNSNEDEHDPDLYDCRFRPWYVQAANYPKNLVILHDVSGSMTGLRREIAKHVVSTILDTLTENDFVTVYNFTDETIPLVPCFGDRLVQANLKNVREFKVALEQDRTAKVANFTTALLKAFEVLERHREPDAVESARCNQAIMLITDGAPYHFEEIFKAKQDPANYVRMFTYLIGREVTDKREVMWMACAHKGYFVHVTTLGEVQEQVLKYMPVMSRPMVMYKFHNISWTPVYADISLYRTGETGAPLVMVPAPGRYYDELSGWSEIELVPLQKFYSDEDVGESDWKWDRRNRGEQKVRSERYKTFIKDWQTKSAELQRFVPPDEHGNRNHQGVSRHLVLEFLNNGELNTTEESRLAKLAEKLRTDYKSNNEKDGDLLQPRAEPITAKKLDMRMRKHFKSQNFKEANRVKWPKAPIFNFMISVSHPVLDLRNATVRDNEQAHELKVKVNDSLTLGTIEQKRIANFLGVVGTDISIKELIRMTSPFKLGVNGYAFAVTNNGHLIFHPDWRPVLPDDILKPNYNSIDLMEIELMDNDTVFRNNETNLYEMRKDMVDQVAGHKYLRIRVHQDNFKRVAIRNQKYEYKKMGNTSYSLAISVPQNMYRFKGEMDVNLFKRDDNYDVTKFLTVKDDMPWKWKLHPDWSYCEYIRTPENFNLTSEKHYAHEKLFLDFLKRIVGNRGSSWKWRNFQASQQQNEPIYQCDRELVLSLIFDANVTEVFSEDKLWTFSKDDPQFISMYGVQMAFISTRSGLTRWIGPLDKNKPISTSDVKFEENNIRAIDELWYKRAVERWYVDRESFVYSIPFDSGTRSPDMVVVTATRAIFVESKGHYAPVAVTGIQFDHEKWREKFFETTGKCMPGADCKNKTCESGTLNCYVLDDNGYVLISETQADHGKFFGEVDGMVMDMMVKSDIYKQVRVVDYQATCLHRVSRSNFANFLTTPFTFLKYLVNLTLSYFAWILLELNVHSLVAPDFTSVLAEMIGDEGGHVIEDPLPFLDLASINKTRLRPCDQEYKLYTYGPTYNTHNMTQKGKLTSCGHNSQCSGFFNVHIIPHTNLILVVTDGTCRCPNSINNHSVKPEEVIYDVDPSIRNLSMENEIVAQICRTPNNPPLYRNRMYNETQCHHYHAEEEGMKADCGLGTNIKSNNIITLASVAFILFKVAFAF